MKKINKVTINGKPINTIALGSSEVKIDGTNVLYFCNESNQIICSLGPAIEHDGEDLKYKKDSDFWDRIYIGLSPFISAHL